MKLHLLLASMVLVTSAMDADAALHKFCVGTDSELETVLGLAPGFAQIDPAGTVDIRLRRRPGQPYILNKVPDTTGAFAYGNLKLRGGYSDQLADDCTEAGRLLNPTATKVIHAPDEPRWLRFHSVGELFVEGISWQVPHGFWVSHGDFYAKVSFVSNIVTSAGNFALLIEKTVDGNENSSYRIVNNLITGIATGGSCAVRLRNVVLNQNYPAGETEVEFANNTIADNAGAAICYHNMASIRLDNNIVWGNAQGVVDVSNADASPITLKYNLLQGGNNMPGLQDTHEGPLSADPMFVNGFQLAGGSPAIDSGGAGSVPGGLPPVDLAGNQRTIGGRVDRGAYEFTGSNVETFEVNTSEDTLDMANGKLSLRSAITLANADPGVETITFDIGGPFLCEATITLNPALGNLPPITQSVVIDGTTQGPSSANTLSTGFDANICVGVQGNGNSSGLRVPTGTSASLTVRGMRLSGFSTAILLQSGSGHRVEGNSFGAFAGSTNQRNVMVETPATEVSVGGAHPSERNLLTGASISSVVLKGNRNYVTNNLIAPWIFEANAQPNQIGVTVIGQDTIIEGNQILASDGTGVLLQGKNARVYENTISYNGRGIEIKLFAGLPDSASNSRIYFNKISMNLLAGIAVGPGAMKNLFFANSMEENDGLAIDLDDDEQVNPNDCDACGTSQDANGGQNFPILTAAATIPGAPHRALLQGSLHSRNGTDYEIRFYVSDACDGSGYGEGATPLGSNYVAISDASAISDGSAEVGRLVEFSGPLAGKFVTATAADGLGNTSEFSPCIQIAGQALPDAIFRDGFE